MKNLIILLSILATGNAIACADYSTAKYACSGDTVVSKNGFVGRVIGVNPDQVKVAVKWHTTSNGYSANSRSSVKTKDLSVGRGCLGYFCVGDTVVSSNGFVGNVIGVNPYTSSAAVKWHTTSNGYSTNSRSTVKIKDLSIGLGCVNGLCIDDSVASDNGFVGRVIGVNPHTSSAAVRWHTTSNGYSTNSRSTFNIDELYIEKYCAAYGASAHQRSVGISIQLRGMFIDLDFRLRFARKH